MQNVERVAISLPKDLVQKAEKARKLMGLNRSELYHLALKAYLENLPDSEEDTRLSELYKEIADTDRELLSHFRGHSYRHLPPYSDVE